MSNTIIFKSRLFPADPEGDLEYCNGQPGSALASWLKEKLQAKGFECDSVIQEDYGWGFWIKNGDLTVWVAAAHVEADSQKDNEGFIQWAVTAQEETPFGFLNPASWFKGKRGNKLESAVYAELKAAVLAEKEISLIAEE